MFNGLGIKTAMKIIENRPFIELNELSTIKGIGPVKIDIIKKNFYV